MRGEKSYTYSVLLFILISVFSKAQNLVPNGNFETYSTCPSGTVTNNDLPYATPWFPVEGTPDYFNSCDVTANDYGVPSNAMGSQTAHSGVGYAGFYTFDKFFTNGGREYIEVLLTSPLISGRKYLVSFYVNLADNPQYSTNSIGAYFSASMITGSGGSVLSYTPQIENKSTNPLTDKINWMLISDTLHAIGGEQYIVIGNFRTDNSCDTLFLGNSTGWNSSYYYIDDVSVIDVATIGVKQFTTNEIQGSIYPNPANERVNIEFSGIKAQETEINLVDVLGKTVLKQKFNTFKETLDVTGLENGVYFFVITDNQKQAVFTKKVVIQH